MDITVLPMNKTVITKKRTLSIFLGLFFKTADTREDEKKVLLE